MSEKCRSRRFLPFALCEALEMRRHCSATLPASGLTAILPPWMVILQPGETVDEPSSVQVKYDDSISNLTSESSKISGVFAQFDGSLNADQYSATIDWGDGRTSSASIERGKDGTYVVDGSHDYGVKGNFDINVEVTASDGSVGRDWHEIYTEADPITFTANADLWNVTGDDSDLYVTSFLALQASSANPFSVEISWGDGATSSGQVIDNGDGTFGVIGSHQCAATGNFAVSVTVTKGAISARTDGTAIISEPSPLDDPILWATDDGGIADGTRPSGGQVFEPIFVTARPFRSDKGGLTIKARNANHAYDPPPVASARPNPFATEDLGLIGDVDPSHLFS